jgi:2-C-methyl-D-erythritol 4-phosphate cytidylyltransferase
MSQHLDAGGVGGAGDGGGTQHDARQVTPFVGSAGAVLLAEDSPLLWAPLLDRPLLVWTVAAFEAAPCIHAIALPIFAGHVAQAQALATSEGWRKTRVVVAQGDAALRTGLQALQALEPSLATVVVHEATRPLVTPELIAAGIHAAQHTGVAVAAEPVTETIKRVCDGLIAQTVPRERLVRAQTPAVFTSAALRSVLQAAPEAAAPPQDMLGVALASSLPVRMFSGGPENAKVDTPDDLAVAEALLRRRRAALAGHGQQTG